MAIQIGDKAPEVLGLDQNGKEIKLSDFKGKKLALYFYPKDNTSGCTAEACSLRDGYKELQAAGYEVVGVSKDSAKSHQGFIAKQELPFSLIADTDTTLQQQFGVWAEKKLYGRRICSIRDCFFCLRIVHTDKISSIPNNTRMNSPISKTGNL